MPEVRTAKVASALAGLDSLDGPVHLVERTGLGAVVVRGAGPVFVETAGRVLGVALPREPNTTQDSGRILVLWLGPDEWLLRLPVKVAEAATVALRLRLADEHAAVVDVSDRGCLLRLSGAPARDVLGHGCPLDLHRRAFRPGLCARTRFGKAPVLIHQVDDRPTYDLETPRSFAGYLWDGLVEASRVGETARSS